QRRQLLRRGSADRDVLLATVEPRSEPRLEPPAEPGRDATHRDSPLLAVDVMHEGDARAASYQRGQPGHAVLYVDDDVSRDGVVQQRQGGVQIDREPTTAAAVMDAIAKLVFWRAFDLGAQQRDVVA